MRVGGGVLESDDLIDVRVQLRRRDVLGRRLRLDDVDGGPDGPAVRGDRRAVGQRQDEGGALVVQRGARGARRAGSPRSGSYSANSRSMERVSAGSVASGGSDGTPMAASYFGLASSPDSSGWIVAMSMSSSAITR